MTKHDKAKLKQQVRQYWHDDACGTVYAVGESEFEQFEQHERIRYELEPYISEFAQFTQGADRDVLEIGVGLGADHLQWARGRPRSLTGLDFTATAVNKTRRRLDAYALSSRLTVADAENLPFSPEQFDLIYSWGVLHHTPDTTRAINEVHRVLKPGGVARIMIYHRYSFVGDMLWLRYGLMSGRPEIDLTAIYHQHLESPGTKAYTRAEARDMMAGFSSVRLWSMVGLGDLLQGSVGQRHPSRMLNFAKRIWPRQLIKRFFHKHGLMLLIEAEK